MAQSSVIREFLVALGFKTDETALKNFESGITKATKAVVGLAAAIEGTAVAVAAGVSRFASNLEALYFASIRTQSSATNLLAFDKAAQNFGASAGEARASVEGLAHALRVNPGNEGFLNGLLGRVGKSARDSSGHLRDLTDVMVDLGRVFAQEPMYLAEQQASMLGISENTMLAMRNGDFARENEMRRRQFSNGHFEKATKDAHRFMDELRTLEVYLQAFGAQVYDALVKRMGHGLHSLTDWLAKNGPMLANRLVDVISKVLDLAERIGPAIAALVRWFVKLDTATHGWSTRIMLGLVALRFLGGAEIITGVIKLTAAILRMGAGLAGAAASGGGLVGILGKLGAVGLAGAAGYGAGTFIKGWIDDLVQHLTGQGDETLGGWLYDITHRGEEALQFFQDRGFSAAQSAGLVANMQAESGMRAGAEGDNGKAYGLMQWHADRQAAFKRVMGKDIRQSTFEDQLNFTYYELTQGAERRAAAMLHAAKTSQQSGQVVSRAYVRPFDPDGSKAVQRGDLAANISHEQNITIHVNGAQDPKAVAREVKSQLARRDATVIRSAAPAF